MPNKEQPFNPEDHLVGPHKKISRHVEEKDIERVLLGAKLMLRICKTPVGNQSGGHALAHAQIDDKDPLRFFVLRDGAVMINPKIMSHTTHKHQKSEGCLTYPHSTENAHVGRYYRCTIEYQTLTKERKLSLKRILHAKGLAAQIAQHEIDHMEGKYIFDESK